MNIIDILLIVVMLIATVGFIGILIKCANDQQLDFPTGFGMFIIYAVIMAFSLTPFVCIDYKSGKTTGTITSVDSNLWGTKALYIRTTANKEEEYCIEDEELKKIAEESVGKEVTISYGKRVGFYSTGACNQSPVDKIEIIETDNNE